MNSKKERKATVCETCTAFFTYWISVQLYDADEEKKKQRSA